MTNEPTESDIILKPRSADVETGTVAARYVAAWLLGEAQAHRLDPIISATPDFDSVQLQVRPASRPVWHTWCNLLGADIGHTTWGSQDAYVLGSWNGTAVRLFGLDFADWVDAR